VLETLLSNISELYLEAFSRYRYKYCSRRLISRAPSNYVFRRKIEWKQEITTTYMSLRHDLILGWRNCHLYMYGCFDPASFKENTHCHPAFLVTDASNLSASLLKNTAQNWKYTLPYIKYYVVFFRLVYWPHKSTIYFCGGFFLFWNFCLLLHHIVDFNWVAFFFKVISQWSEIGPQTFSVFNPRCQRLASSQVLEGRRLNWIPEYKLPGLRIDDKETRGHD